MDGVYTAASPGARDGLEGTMWGSPAKVEDPSAAPQPQTLMTEDRKMVKIVAVDGNGVLISIFSEKPKLGYDADGKPEIVTPEPVEVRLNAYEAHWLYSRLFHMYL